jgi:lysophospholipase L1-like esterase
MATFVIFGDSIAAGCWDEHGGWAERLRQYLYQQVIASNYDLYHEIHNLSVSGDTTQDLINRFSAEMEARVWEDDSVIFFAVGINDSQVILETSQNVVSLEQFEKNLQVLFTKANTYTAHTIAVGLTPIDEATVNPMPWKPENAYVTTEVKKYDTALQRVCNAHQVEYLPLHDVFSSTATTHFLADGVHLTSHGHEIIFAHVLQLLQEKQLIK